MAATGGSKAFMLDKYFYELQRFWDTEWKLEEGMSHINLLIRSMLLLSWSQ